MMCCIGLLPIRVRASNARPGTGTVDAQGVLIHDVVPSLLKLGPVQERFPNVDFKVDRVRQYSAITADRPIAAPEKPCAAKEVPQEFHHRIIFCWVGDRLELTRTKGISAQGGLA